MGFTPGRGFQSSVTLSDLHCVYQKTIAAIQMREAWKERGLKAKRSGWNQGALLFEQRNEVVVGGWGNVKGREEFFGGGDFWLLVQEMKLLDPVCKLKGRIQESERPAA